MHLGQAADFLADVLNRPAPSVRMVSRLLREGGWIAKGARGRNAPHLTGDEVAAFLIALMCAPDSPALALERLPHFLELPHDPSPGAGGVRHTLKSATAILLERIAGEDWPEVEAKDWRIGVAIHFSTATIGETHPGPDGTPIRVQHDFGAIFGMPKEQPAKDAMPYFGGLEIHVSADVLTLFRIAKVVLGNQADPLEAIATASKTGPED